MASFLSLTQSVIGDNNYTNSEIWPKSDIPHMSGIGILEYGDIKLNISDIHKIDIHPVPLEEGDWFGEDFMLSAETLGGKTFMERFYAANGYFNVSVPFGLWGGVRKFVVLIRSTSKGTGVFDYDLSVYRVSNDDLVNIFEKKISGYQLIPNESRWWYKIKINRINFESHNYMSFIELVLERDTIRQGDGVLNFLPSENNICLYYKNDKVYQRINISCEAGTEDLRE